MKTGTRLETSRLVIRHWTLDETDREFFHYLNSSDDVMEFFPFRWTRTQSGEMLEKLVRLVEADGLGWSAACLKGADRPIGFTGLSPVRFDARFTPAVEIGWRFQKSSWGQGYATEAALALLAHGFEDLRLTEIVSFAVASNILSIAVMKRIGMRREPGLDFDHPRVPQSHPHLRRHAFYRLTQDDWLRGQKGRP